MRVLIILLLTTLALSSCFKENYGCKCYPVTDPTSFGIYPIGKKTNAKATSECQSMEKDMNKNATVPIRCETGIYAD